MNRSTASIRDDFEAWLADMDAAIERFMAALPEHVRARLDFTPESLDVLENWLLERYPSVDAALVDSEKEMLDGAGRYVGECFRHTLGGRWDIELDNPNDVNYRLPVLTGFNGEYTKQSPITLVTAALDRRTGSYMRSVLRNIQRRAASS